MIALELSWKIGLMMLIALVGLISLVEAQDYVGQQYIYTCWYKCYVNGVVNEDGFDNVVAHTNDEAMEKFQNEQDGCGHCVVMKLEKGKPFADGAE